MRVFKNGKIGNIGKHIWTLISLKINISFLKKKGIYGVLSILKDTFQVLSLEQTPQ